MQCFPSSKTRNNQLYRVVLKIKAKQVTNPRKARTRRAPRQAPKRSYHSKMRKESQVIKRSIREKSTIIAALNTITAIGVSINPEDCTLKQTNSSDVNAPTDKPKPQGANHDKPSVKVNKDKLSAFAAVMENLAESEDFDFDKIASALQAVLYA